MELGSIESSLAIPPDREKPKGGCTISEHSDEAVHCVLVHNGITQLCMLDDLAIQVHKVISVVHTWHGMLHGCSYAYRYLLDNCF